MLSQVASMSHLSSLPSSADWCAVTVDDCFPSVSPLAAAPGSPSASPSVPALSSLRGLAERRHKHKLAAGDFLAPLTPHLYPRTPFCSPSSSPHPLDALSALTSPLPAGVSSYPSGTVVTPASRRKHSSQPSQQSQQQHLTVHTSTSFSSCSSTQSPHSARSHSVPFLPFRYFDDVSSPHSGLSFPEQCTPFPSPVLPSSQRWADLAPPSPLLMTRPSSPQLQSAASRSSAMSALSLSQCVHEHDYTSSLFVPASLSSNQPPLSPAVVPLTPPSSPLPLAACVLSPASSSSSLLSASPSWRLSVPSLW